MKKMKKFISVVICALTVTLCFAGCSSATEAEVIDDETMLIAYTAEKSPFIYTDENGKLTGFDVELIKSIFDDVKGEYKTYSFVQVDEDYAVGEDVAYTDDEGNEYIAYVMVGGISKDTGSFNKNYSYTNDLITDRVIAVTAKDSQITSYAALGGVKAGVVSEAAVAALDKNTIIKDGFSSIEEYADIAQAMQALDAGQISVIITDEFNFNAAEGKDNYSVLNGELDSTSYVFSFKKWDAAADTYNEAFYELKNPDYNGADEFTPIVEKYFGYNASSFEYVPQND